MFTTKKAIATRVLLPNHPKRMVAPCQRHGEGLLDTASLGNIRTIALTQSNLFVKLTDTNAEQLCGGAIQTPEGSAGNSAKAPNGGGSISTTPVAAGPGLIPFYPALPTRKLAGLGHLNGATKTSKTGGTMPIPPKPYDI
ncbi:hypothetical protein NIES4074_56390 [Cylindrospermum sp. NIES-4074]|nr:hypothetical protein NIES4074_56390 [Cylindrospermum sp. NIES-4074]